MSRIDIFARISPDMRNAANHVLCILPNGITPTGTMAQLPPNSIADQLWLSGGMEFHAISGRWPLEAFEGLSNPEAVTNAMAGSRWPEDWGEAEAALCAAAQAALTLCERDPETGGYDVPAPAANQIVMIATSSTQAEALLGMTRKPEPDDGDP